MIGLLVLWLRIPDTLIYTKSRSPLQIQCMIGINMTIHWRVQAANFKGWYEGNLVRLCLRNTYASEISLGHIDCFIINIIITWGVHSGPVVPIKLKIKDRWREFAVIIPIVKACSGKNFFSFRNFDGIAILLSSWKLPKSAQWVRTQVDLAWHAMLDVIIITSPSYVVFICDRFWGSTVDAHKDCERRLCGQ